MASTPSRDNAAAVAAQTPIQIRTPAQRILNDADPTSSLPRRLGRTPLPRSAPRDLANSIRRNTLASGGAGRRATNNAPTPHATAARRALHLRRTAIFTPGKNRRRSLKDQRETPMGVLRNLSRALAPTTKPISSSSSSPQEGEDDDAKRKRRRTASMTPLRDMDDDEDELTIDRPRLSLPLMEEDDDEEELRPPRSSILDGDDFTVQSIELPRRVLPHASRLSRGSPGSVRVSDVFGDVDPTQTLIDRSEFFPGLLEDLQATAQERNDEALQRIDDDNDGDDETRRTTLGRESDFGFQMPEVGDDQTTFMFDDQADPLPEPSPVNDPTLNETVADDDNDDDPGGFSPLPEYDDHSSPAPTGHVDITAEDEPLDEGSGSEEPTAAVTVPFSVKGPSRQLLKKGRSQLEALKRQKRISQHGIEYPALPPAFVKRVASTALQSSGLSNHRITPDTLAALTQASEWFFEQLGDDLAAYASHAKRKTIEETDVSMLMRRQRQVGAQATVFSIAQKHLPRELLQDLRMPVHHALKKRARRTAAAKED